MSYQEHVESFNEILKSNTWWSRVLGSQFATGIATFVGQMVERSQSLARRLLQETFMSTATKRSSILAAAEDRGYVGRKITPSTGSVTITNNSTGSLTLPYGQPLDAPNKLPYVLYQAVELDPGETQTVKVAQLEEVILSATVTVATKWMEILLTKELTKTAASVDVYVTLPNGSAELWEKRYQFRRATSDSKIYTEFYKPSEQLGIRFGNGLSGRIPPIGAVIELHVWSTTGDSTLVEGQQMQLADVSDVLAASVAIKTTSAITGGAEGESTEEIRKGALYATAYDDEIVWSNDYKHFIKENVQNLSWLNVWGEVEQEKETGYSLNNIGRIFVSAYSPTKSQADLSDNVLALLATTKALNRRYSYVPVVRKPFTVTVNVVIAARQQALTVKQTMMEALEADFGADAIARLSTTDDTTIYEKEIWATLRALNNAVEFTLTVNNQERKPKLNEYVFLDAANSTFNIEYQSNA